MTASIRVLLMEDNPLDQRMALEILLHSNQASFVPFTATSLAEGLSHLRQHNIDVVLLDLSLPDTKGLNTLLSVRAEFPRVPIVVLTGLDNEATAIAAMHQGAQDYLVKWQIDASSLLRAVLYAIQRNNNRQLESSIRAKDAELQAARQIQQALFPASAPTLAGFDLAGTWHPADATCGDYYDFMSMLDGHWGIAVGDVCGHGLGPALLMAEMRACLRTLTLTHLDVAQILTIANRMLTDDIAGDRFITVFFARLNPSSASLSYAGAGHRAYVIDSSGNVRTLDSTGIPLGLDRELPIVCAPEVQLSPGDQLLIVTDGIEEALSPEGQTFGINKLVPIVHTYRHESAQQIVDRIVHESVPNFIRDGSQSDDFTAVLLKVKPDANTCDHFQST